MAYSPFILIITDRVALLVASRTFRANAICRVVATAFTRTLVTAKCLVDMTLGDPWR
jgi:hypothetical protein